MQIYCFFVDSYLYNCPKLALAASRFCFTSYSFAGTINKAINPASPVSSTHRLPGTLSLLLFMRKR